MVGSIHASLVRSSSHYRAYDQLATPVQLCRDKLRLTVADLGSRRRIMMTQRRLEAISATMWLAEQAAVFPSRVSTLFVARRWLIPFPAPELCSASLLAVGDDEQAVRDRRWGLGT